MKTYLSIVVPVLALLTLGSCRTKQQDGPIKCMTFNIRYDNRGDSLNSWETRRDTIAKFINSEHPDIFGLQEVLANQLHDLTVPPYSGTESGLRRWTKVSSGCHNILTVPGSSAGTALAHG